MMMRLAIALDLSFFPDGLDRLTNTQRGNLSSGSIVSKVAVEDCGWGWVGMVRFEDSPAPYFFGGRD